MQCRRREDYYDREPESMKLRAQDLLHLDHGRYGKPIREELSGSPCIGRSSSPHRIGGSRREMGFGRRVDGNERRDDDWRLRTGRNDDIRSSSHSYGQVRERPNYEELFPHNDHKQLSELQRARVLPKPRKFSSEDEVLDYNHDLRYRQDDLRIRKEREFSEGRWSDGSGIRMTDKKLLALEEGPYNSHLDMGLASVYRDFLPSSQVMHMQSLDNERIKFRDHVVSDKSQGPNFHEVEESCRYNSRNIGYSASLGFHSREYESSSSGHLTGKCLESYQNGQDFQIADEFSARSHRDLMGPKEFNSYGKRTHLDSSINLVNGKKNLTPHQQGMNSPRREHVSYFYSELEGTLNDSFEDLSRAVQKSTQTHDYIGYDSALMSDHGDFSRPKVGNSSLLKLHNSDDSYANHRPGITLDRHSLRKKTELDCPDMELTRKAMNHDSEYAGTKSIHAEVVRKLTRDYEISHLNPFRYRQMLHTRSDYGSEREEGSQLLKERLHESSMSKYDGEAYRNTESVHRMTEGVPTCNSRGKMSKRKYFEEDMNLLNHRMGMSCEYTHSKVVDLYNSSEEWMDDGIYHRYVSKKPEFDHNRYKKPNKKYGHNLYASDDSFPRENYLDRSQKYKNGPTYMKHNRRNDPSNTIKLQNVDRRNRFHKPREVWKKTEGEDAYIHVNDDGLSDDLVIPTESEPPEDSDKFKEMVHEAFLKCSKKLNMKPSVQKKYKEQGNASSLYCIVCGRSNWKEFLDTQRLVKHAYMSHKMGLRAQHLGLAKAICVLMGWNSALREDTVTWVPEVLPKEEAVDQKEDLIIWPPVIIIRNISMTYSNPKKWRVITMEALETFLRSKNLLKGRVKISLGYPADQSVMVLKFLPTFSGLTDAERLNKFFSEKRHGRMYFELSKGNNDSTEMEGDKIEEEVLYGYLGTAEDLIGLEFNIRKLSSIKSKKEILEF